MRRPAGVIVAAVILGVIALCGLLFSVLLLGIVLLVHTPIIPKLPAVHLGLTAVAACMIAWFAFCAWTVAGLVRMRAWARYATLVIAALQFVFNALLCAGTLLAASSAPPLPPTPTPLNLHAILAVIAGFYALLSIVGASWLVYFNLRDVRSAFRSAQQSVLAAEATAPPPELPARIHGY